MTRGALDRLDQIGADRRHGDRHHPLDGHDHTAVARPFHLDQHPLLPAERTARDTHAHAPRPVDLLGPQPQQAVVAAARHGDEAAHLIVGHDDHAPGGGIGYVLQVSGPGLDPSDGLGPGVHEDQVADGRYQAADLPAPNRLRLPAHGDEVFDAFRFEQPHGSHLPVEYGTHGKPGLFIFGRLRCVHRIAAEAPPTGPRLAAWV